MRKILLITIVMVMSCISAFSQNTKTLGSLLFDSSDSLEIGWFIQPEDKAFFNQENYNQQKSNLVGGKIGVSVNETFRFGFSGYAKTNRLTYNTDYSVNGVTYGYGGVYMAYAMFHESVVHIQFGLSAGYGGANEFSFAGGYRGATHNTAGFIYVEPEMNIEINLTKFVKLTAGIDCRFLDTSNFLYVERSGLDGFALKGGLLIGK